MARGVRRLPQTRTKGGSALCSSGPPSGGIRQNWNDTEKISSGPCATAPLRHSGHIHTATLFRVFTNLCRHDHRPTPVQVEESPPADMQVEEGPPAGQYAASVTTTEEDCYSTITDISLCEGTGPDMQGETLACSCAWHGVATLGPTVLARTLSVPMRTS